MRSCLILLMLAVAGHGCSNLETIENRDENGVLIEKYTRKKNDQTRHGSYTAYYPDGTVREEATYHNEALTGERKVYFENGNIDYIETYKKGQFEGPYKKYYEDGQLSNEGQYVDNEMSGIWKRWYPGGELREEVTFDSNNENGPFIEYYENGAIKAEGVYVNGDNETGELKKYDEQGRLSERMYCIYGVCSTTWTEENGEIAIDTARLQRLADIKREAEDGGNE